MKKILFFTLFLFSFGSAVSMQPEVKQEAESALAQDSGEFICNAIINYPQLRSFLSDALLSIDSKFPEAIDELISQYLSPNVCYYIPMPDEIRNELAGKDRIGFNIILSGLGNKISILVMFDLYKNGLNNAVLWNITTLPTIWIKINNDNQAFIDSIRKTRWKSKTQDESINGQMNVEGLILEIDLKVLHKQYVEHLAGLQKKQSKQNCSSCCAIL
jgi:hypothetical protein